MTRLGLLVFIGLSALFMGCGGRVFIDGDEPSGGGGSTGGGAPSCTPGEIDPLADTDHGSSMAISLAGDDLFFTATDGAAGRVVRVPRAGGDSKILVEVDSPNLFGIAADGDHVFFHDEMTLWRVDASGGGLTEIASSAPVTGLALDEAHVYWTSKASVNRSPKQGGPVEIVSAAAHPTRAIAVDGASVYYFRQLFDNDITHEELVRTDLAGGATTVLLTGDFSGAIALDATHVYFFVTDVDDTTSLAKIAKSGGAPTTLTTDFQFGSDIVVDGNRVYFSNSTAFFARTLVEVPSLGGIAKTLSDETMHPFGIAVDPTYVYTTTVTAAGGPIFRVCR